MDNAATGKTIHSSHFSVHLHHVIALVGTQAHVCLLVASLFSIVISNIL